MAFVEDAISFAIIGLQEPLDPGRDLWHRGANWRARLDHPFVSDPSSRERAGLTSHGDGVNALAQQFSSGITIACKSFGMSASGQPARLLRLG
jgi:hypothetical protein